MNFFDKYPKAIIVLTIIAMFIVGTIENDIPENSTKIEVVK